MIIGRSDEQLALRRLVADACGGRGGYVTVVGEPGIGKTALLDDLVDDSGLRVQYACGHEWEADLPYAALGDLLHPLLGSLTGIPGPQAAALARALGIEDGPPGDPIAVEVATTSLLRIVSDQRPILIVVDDLHWIDSASRDVVLFVARRAATMRVAIVGAARSEALTPALAGLPVLAVEPLATPAAERLLHERANGELSRDVALSLVQLGGGNPLALQELVDGLTIEQRRGQAPIVEPINVSAAVVHAFRRRLDGLPADTRTAMLVAAAEGRGRVGQVRDALAELGSSTAALEVAERDGLVAISDGIVSFRHPVMRSVVHQTAAPSHRRAAHAALASVEPDEDRRAWHMSASVAEPDATVSLALAELAKRALARGADATASLALSRAAELAESPDHRGLLYAKAARAANRSGDGPNAKRLLDLAWPLIEPDPLGRADLVLLEADLGMRNGQFDQAARRLSGEAMAIADLDRRRATAMLVLAAKVHVYRMEGEAALAAVDQALDLIPDPQSDLLSLSSLAMTQAMAGHVDAASTVARAAELGMATQRGHLYALAIAWPLIWLERYELATRFLTWAITVQRDGGYHSFLPQSLMPQAELDLRAGDWGRARATASEAIELFNETGQTADAALAAGTMARIAAALGDVAGCRRHAQAALDSDSNSGLRAATAFAESALGHLCLAMGHPDDAVVHLDAARVIAQEGGVAELSLVNVHADLVEALLLIGRRREATKVAAELQAAAERAERSERTDLIALAARCQGLLVDGAESVAILEHALDMHRQAGGRFDQARTELWLARRLVDIGLVSPARQSAAAAVDTFRRLGARLWLESARRVLGEIEGEQPASTAIDGLTAREQEVAAMVSCGASNRTVAEALYVNPKTVEFHLANVYRKLGVRNRTELALRWRDGQR